MRAITQIHVSQTPASMLPFRFCPGCGAADPELTGAHQVRCSTCGFQYFHNAAAAATAIIEHQGRVLLVRRARDPAKGLLDLPGGFVGHDESLDTALVRELREELSIKVHPDDLTYLGSHHNRYPYDAVTYFLCDSYFVLRLSTTDGLRADDDVSAIEWWDQATLPWEEISFPTITWALDRFFAAGG
jgi:ADP-ribose pyrophosphatase YjhB (NUDIX family)